MSSLALHRPDGTIVAGEDVAAPVRKRLKEARQWRRQFELGWMLSMALAAGKHWQTADRNTRTLRRVQDVDPNYRGRELYTADEVTEYRTTMLGELGSDNDLPQLLLRRDDQASEEYEGQANRAVQYGWETEWRGDDVLAEIDRLIVDLGTAAVRCRYDNQQGPLRNGGDPVPHVNGKPVLSTEQATSLLGNGTRPDVQMKPVRQGRICWEALSPFNLLVPPGITHEDLFPWECVMRPVLLSTVQQLYPDTTQGLREDSDIGTILGTDARTPVGDANAWASRDGAQGRLRDHVWLFTYYERPTTMYANGRVIVFAGNEMRLLSVDDEQGLPYRDPNGEARSGIAYFHWWRVTGRFWSRSLVDSMKDGQRLLDKRRTQINEIIDRSLPFLLVEKNSKALDRTGVPMEFVEVAPSERPPQLIAGAVPAWMQQDVESIREDLEHATGIKGPRLGDNPSNVNTYSQLALISQQEQTKRDQIHRERKQRIGRLIEDSVYDIRNYWGPEKQIALAGDEDELQAEVFDATKIPDFYVVRVATGSAKPRQQAAQIQMVQDIWTGAVAAMRPVPPEWLTWYAKSLQAGEPLDLPEPPTDPQHEKALMENHALLAGEQVAVAYYDMVAVHIPVHREAQDQAQLVGDVATWQRIEQHVVEHQQIAAQNAAQQQQLAGPPPAPASAGAPVAAPPQP